MKNIYKIAIISLLFGFATGALATPESDTDVIETQTSETISATVSERKSCDDIAAEIAELSAIEDPDTEKLNTLEKLKTKQRSICNKDAGARSGRSATKMRSRSPKSPSRIRPTEQDSASQTTDSETKTNQTCDTPDQNGCCPGEKYTDMGELGFNCCPETGGDCFPPITTPEETTPEQETISDTQPTPDVVTETESEPMLSEQPPAPESETDEIAKNIEQGLCADGSTPNKFGCCNDEVFKEVENLTFACCPPDGGDCFPPIK